MMEALISLTTIPDRIEYLRPCLDSLKQQGLPVYLWLPRHVQRLGRGFDKIPDWLLEQGINATLVEDMGPITKLLPALTLADIIITADDDHIYGPGWANGLLRWASKYPNAALGYRGRRLTRGLIYNKSKLIRNPKKPIVVNLITGVYGALYRSAFFNASIYNEWREWPVNDDIVVGAHFLRRGIRSIIVPIKCTISKTEADPISPLYKANTGRCRLNDEGLALMYSKPRKR